MLGFLTGNLSVTTCSSDHSKPSIGSGSALADSWFGGVGAQMSHLQDPVQDSVVDGRGGTDGSISEEESSHGSEDGVGRSDGTVDRQVEFHV